MVALVGGFNTDVMHAEVVEQKTRQLCTGTGVTVGWIAVALEHPAYPETGPEHEGKQRDDHDDKSHAVIVACLSSNE